MSASVLSRSASSLLVAASALRCLVKESEESEIGSLVDQSLLRTF